MEEKNKKLFLKIVLVLSVYFVWAIILSELVYDSEAVPFYAIPFTILSIYIWNRVDKK